MFKRAGLLVFVLILGCTAAMAQKDAFLGTWKVDMAHSRFDPGPAPESRVTTWEAGQDGVKETVNSINEQGKPTQTLMTLKLDGKAYPDRAPQTTTTCKRINDHTYERVQRVNGKVTVTAHVGVSRDGKIMTIMHTGMNAKGQTVNDKIVLMKQ